MQSIHAVLQNVHTEILVMHTYCGIASITEGNITLLFNTVKCRDPQLHLPHQPPNCKLFSHGTVLILVSSSSSALQDFKAQCNSNAALWFSRLLLVPPCLLCSSPNCTLRHVSTLAACAFLSLWSGCFTAAVTTWKCFMMEWREVCIPEHLIWENLER